MLSEIRQSQKDRYCLRCILLPLTWDSQSSQIPKKNVVTKSVKNESESFSVVSNSSRPHGLYSSWNSPDQNTGVVTLSLFQGIFSTQGSNPDLPHCMWILYQLGHKGSPNKSVARGKCGVVTKWVYVLFMQDE